ncbi:MAG: hypothetical protein ABFD84_17255 [Candidatus Polarisedimenticolia bacterium]
MIGALLLLACVGGAPASPPDSQRSDARYVEAAKAVADEVGPLADIYMQVVLRSPWGAYYSMLFPPAPESLTAEYGVVKSEELWLRDALQRMMPPDAVEWSLGYGDFLVFTDRPFATVAEAQKWREESAGDMYLGRFQKWTYGRAVEQPVEELAEVTRDASVVEVEIPIVRQSRFVCVMVVTLRR